MLSCLSPFDSSVPWPALGFRGVCSFLVSLHPRLLGCGVISFFRLEGLGGKNTETRCLHRRPAKQSIQFTPRFPGRLGLQVCDRNTHCMDWGMIGVIIAPLVLPIEAVATQFPDRNYVSHWSPWWHSNWTGTESLHHHIPLITIATTELHWMACITIDSMPGVSENPRSGRLRTAYALASLLPSRSKDTCGRAEHCWKWASSSWEGDISRIPTKFMIG